MHRAARACSSERPVDGGRARGVAATRESPRNIHVAAAVSPPPRLRASLGEKAGVFPNARSKLRASPRLSPRNIPDAPAKLRRPARPSGRFPRAGSERAKIKEAHPDWSLGDIGRELGKRWNALDDAGKKPFQDLAAEDGERHKREMAAYQAKKAAEAEGGGGDDAMED